MYQKFVTTQLHIDKVNRAVSVDFTFDVDEDTIDNRSLFVTKENDMNLIKCKYHVDGSVVTILFDKDFDVNQTYTLYATRKILSVTGEKLNLETVRSFCIESNVDSECRITNPANHEDIKTLEFGWEEIKGKSQKLVNSFFIEIAPDAHFFRPLLQTEVVGRKTFKIHKLEQCRQYWVRVRSQLNTEDYSNWSEPVTFTYTAPKEEIEEDDDIIYIKPLEILSRPTEGTTPKHSFIFEFDKDIDPVSLEDNIKLFRKDW
jgi:hypothetical protein